jgi:hypothetical protein
MPLVSATFQAELVGIFEKGPSGNKSGKKVGIDVSKAYMNYIPAFTPAEIQFIYALETSIPTFFPDLFPEGPFSNIPTNSA